MEAHRKVNLVGKSLFIGQQFCEVLPKLSNKGWATHDRVLVLDSNSVSYYRKVPKNFDKDGKCFPANATVQKLTDGPKQSVNLKSVTGISIVEHMDKKKFGKLKSLEAEKKYLKIEFLKPASSGSKSETDESPERKQGNKSEKSKQAWYFQA